jgi:hypothetical protein
MKLLFLSLLTAVMVGSTDAERMIRMIFNSGISPTADTFCSSSDNAHIDKIFHPIKRERYLREAMMTTSDNNESTDTEITDRHVDRELWPTYCKNNCAGYTTGTCRATNCVGYRKKNRRQTQTLTCDDQVQTVHAELDLLMTTKLSSTCALYLKRENRIAECFDDVIYGAVENFVLWKSLKFNKDYNPGKSAKPGQQAFTLVNNLKSQGTVTNGFTICHYDRINIEAVVNPCVKFINSTLTNPTGFTVSRTDGAIPYTVFGNDQNTPLGRELPQLGTYTFTAIPDNMNYKKTSISFNVTRC